MSTLRSEVFLVFALFLSLFLVTSAGFDTSEGRYHYMISHQILTEGSLSFAEPQVGIFTVAPNGRTYASHEIGNTLFLLPVAAFNIGLEKVIANRTGGRKIDPYLITGFFVSLMPDLYCALAAAFLYALLRLVFLKSVSTALSASLAFAFCTFVWNYSRNLFDGVLCMALLAGAMLSIMRFKKTEETRLFVLGTALCGFGVITRLSMVLPLVAFAVYLTMSFWPDHRRLVRLALIATLVLAPFAAWQTYYNHLRTGNWLVSPVQTAQYAAENGLTGNLAVGLAGLLFSPGKSIFVYVPLTLISIICFRRFRADWPSEAAFVAVLSGLWLLLHAKLARWDGSSGWGPRYFITVAPVLVLPACVAWEWMKESRWRRWLLTGALAWGAILSGASIVGNWQFRVRLANAQERENTMIWSLTGGQALDMIEGAASNVRNMVLRLPGPTLPGLSPMNRYASNTVNVWINSAAFMGIPPILLAGAASVLIAVAVYCAIALRRISLRT